MNARLTVLLLCGGTCLAAGPARAADVVRLSGPTLAKPDATEGVFAASSVFDADAAGVHISNRSLPIGLPSHPLGRRYGRADYRLDEPVALTNDPQRRGDAVLTVEVRRGEADSAGFLEVQLVADGRPDAYVYRVPTGAAPTERSGFVTVDLDRPHDGDAPSGVDLRLSEIRIGTGTDDDEITQLDIASVRVVTSEGTARAGEDVLARLNPDTYRRGGATFGAAAKPGVVTPHDGYLTLDTGSVPRKPAMKEQGGPRFARIDVAIDPPLALENDPQQRGDVFLEVDYRRGADDKVGVFLVRLADDDGGATQSFAYRIDGEAQGVKAGDGAFRTVRIDLDDLDHGPDLSEQDLGLKELGIFTPWLDDRRTQIDIAELRLMRPGTGGGAAVSGAPAPPDVPVVARLNAATFRADGERADGAAFPDVFQDRGDFLTLDTGRIPRGQLRDHAGGPQFARADLVLDPPRDAANDPTLRGDFVLELDYRRGPDDEVGIFIVRVIDADGGDRQGFNYPVRAEDTGATPGASEFTRVRIDLDDLGHGPDLKEMDLGLVRLGLMTRWGETRRTQFDLLDLRLMRGDTKPEASAPSEPPAAPDVFGEPE